MSGGGADRERRTESEAGSSLGAVNTELNAGLELTNHDHDLSRSGTLNPLSHPGAPSFYFSNVYLFLTGGRAEREEETESAAGCRL